MSVKHTLTDPTNKQINAAVAELVAGWRLWPKIFHNQAWHRIPTWVAPPFAETENYRASCGQMLGAGPAPFATSANAVLPLLEKYGAIASRLPLAWSITLAEKTPDDGQIYSVKVLARAKAATFSLAASIALLRAHGVDVAFTK